MPFSSEELAKKFGESAEDVKKSLEGMLGAADDVDKAFEKMIARQEAAAQVMAKFDKAVAASSKGLFVFGHSGVSAARGLRTIDAISKSTANSLGAVGVGAATAVAGLKAMSGGAAALSSDVTGSVKALDDLIQKVNALPKNIKVNVGGAGAAAKMPKAPVTPSTPAASPSLTPSQASTVSGKSGAKAGTKYMDEYLKKVKQSAGKMKMQLAKMKDKEGDVAPGDKEQFADLSGQIRANEALKDYITWMEDGEKATFEAEAATNGLDKAVENLKKDNYELAASMQEAYDEGREGAEEMTSVLAKLERQVQKDATSFGSLFKKSFAEGGVEMSKFMEGLGGNAVGMTAVGVAGAYLATKLGDVAKKFADSAVNLAKYKTETAALEDVIIGMNKGGLDEMRKQLSMTRDQASDFFEVVKRGVNDLGMSQAQIMGVAKALRETFGGDQTERLKQYVDLLEMIPTIDTDLKITASMDDQAAAIFALAESGKMEVVMDLQGAGLLGGTKEKKPGADMANAAQKTAAVTEGIHDFLLNKMFPEFGNYLAAGVEEASKAAEAMFATAGVVGALSFLTKQASADNLVSREVATGEIVAAIESQAAGANIPTKKMPGVGPAGSGLTKLGPKLLKVGKGLTIVAVATLAAEAGFYFLEKHLRSTGNEFGAAGASIGKSAASIAGFAAAGAVIGSVFPGLGTAIGAVIGAAVGLYMEFDNLSRSIPTIVKGWFGKQETPASKALATNDEKQRRMQVKMIKSGMELQRTLKKIDTVAKNAKNNFYKMQKELAGLKIESLQDMGGDMVGFSSAVQDAATATRKQYQMQVSDFAKMRSEVMSNTKMEADERRSALDRLNKEELLATKNFVDGVNGVIEALFKTPKMIQAGLQAQIATAMLDFADMGGMGSKEIGGYETDQAKALKEELDLAMEAVGKSAEHTAGVVETLSKKRESREQAIGDLLEQIEKKRASGAIDEAEMEARKRMVEAQGRKDEIKSSKTGGGTAGAVVTAVAGPAFGAAAAILDQRRKENEKAVALAKVEGEIADAEGAINVQMMRRGAEAKMAKDLSDATYKDTKTGKTKVDTKKAVGILSQITSDQEQNSRAIEMAQKDLIENMGASTAKMMKDKAKEVADAQKRVTTAGEALDTAHKSGKGVEEAGKEKEAADEAFTALQDQMTELRKQLSDRISKMDTTLDPAVVKGIVDKMMDTGSSIGEMETELKKHQVLWDGYQKGIDANTKAMHGLEGLKVQKDYLAKTETELKAVVESESGINLALANSLSSIEKVKELTNKAIAAQTARVNRVTEEVRLAQQAADMTERVAAAEGAVGDGIKAQGIAAKAQVAAIREAVKNNEGTAAAIEAGIPVLEAQIAGLTKTREYYEKMYDALPKDTSEAARAAVKGQLDAAKVNEASYKTQLSMSRQNANTARKSAQQAKEALGQAGDMISKAFDSFDKSVTGARLKNFDEYAQVLIDTADYAGDVADVARKSFEIAKATSKERYEADKKALEAGLAADRAANEERLRTYMSSEAVAGMSPEQKKAAAAQAKSALEATTQSKYQLESAKVELKQKKGVVDAAKRSKDLKEKELDIQQGVLDEAMSFASDFGGSFASIMKLQQLNVGLARQQLDDAKAYRDQLVAAGTEGLELQQAQADVVKQQFNLRRKELGVQKDMMERMLGSIFGELNASFGARRQRGTDQGLMGVNATRMKTAGGMYVNVPGGAPGTIAERQAQRMTAGMGGVFAPGGGGTADQGFMGEVEKALKTAPARSPLEAALGKAAGATADNTEKTAEATEAMAKQMTGGKFSSNVKKTAEATKKDAANTTKELKIEKTDSKSHGEVAKTVKGEARKAAVSKAGGGPMLGGVKTGIGEMGGTKFGIKEMGGSKFQTAQQLLGTGGLTGLGGTKGGTAASFVGSGGRTALAGTTGATAASLTKGGATGMGVSKANSGAGTQTMAGKAAGTAVAPPSVGTQVAAAGAAKGTGGAAATEGTSIKVTGEMLVHWDSGMFKDQMAKVMGSLITTPEIAKAIQGVAFQR